MNVWFELALIAVLVLVNAAMAGSEAALISLRETQLSRLARSGQGGSAAARLARDPSRFLSTVQVAITLAGFLASAIGAISLANPIAASLPFLGAWAEPASVVFVTLVLAAVTLILGELVPKRLAMQRAESWARIAGRPLRTVAFLASPVVWILTRATDLLVRILGGDPSRRTDALSEEEIREVISVGAASPEHRTVLLGAWEIAQRPVREVMVHRLDVLAFPVDTPSPIALNRLVKETHTRAPVYGHDLDDLVGVVNMTDLIGAEGKVREHARPAFALPQTTKVLPALSQMQERREHMAVVVNEHGGTEGILTVEDLLEEVVGEIKDEFDTDHKAAVATDSGGLEVPGSMTIADLRDLGVELPFGNYATVGGLLNSELGRLARPGDDVTFERWRVHVISVGHRATARVRIEPLTS